MRVAGVFLAVGLLAVPVAAGAAVSEQAPPASSVQQAPGTKFDLLPGKGSARVAIAANGKFAVVHQGSSYAPERLLKINLRGATPQVTGQLGVASNANSQLALAKNKFALTTEGDRLWVSDVRKASPKRVGRFSFKIKGSKATLFDVVASPNGKFAYVAANDWIHSPGSHVLVLKIRKNGKPKLLRRVKVTASTLGLSRNGKRLVVAADNRVRVFNTAKAAKPKPMGKAFKVKGGDVRAVAFGKSAKFAYTLSANSNRYVVARVHTKKRQVTHRRTVATGSFLGSGGGLAVSANGKRVVATSDEFDDDVTSVWLLNAKLKAKGTLTGPCFPESAAASLRGPTKGRLYVGDSGICDRAGMWRVR